MSAASREATAIRIAEAQRGPAPGAPTFDPRHFPLDILPDRPYSGSSSTQPTTEE